MFPDKALLPPALKPVMQSDSLFLRFTLPEFLFSTRRRQKAQEKMKINTRPNPSGLDIIFLPVKI
jgi:hypothetical protein